MIRHKRVINYIKNKLFPTPFKRRMLNMLISSLESKLRQHKLSERTVCGRNKDLPQNYEDQLFENYKKVFFENRIDINKATLADLGSGDCYHHAARFIQEMNVDQFYLIDQFITLNTAKKNRNLTTQKIFLLEQPSHQIKLPSSKIDCVISTSLFEHIPIKLISPTVTELARILKPGGHAIVSIDLRDHGDFDQPFDFYRYSKFMWQLTTKKLSIYTNRLRASDFVQYFDNKYFTLKNMETTISSSPIPQKITSEFRQYSEKDLRTTYILLILKRTGFNPFFSLSDHL